MRARANGFAAVALPVLLAAVAACSASGQAGGWCGRVERVTQVESGGLGRLALDASLVDAFAMAYEDLVEATPAGLAPDVLLVRDFASSIAVRLADGTDPMAVIDQVTTDYDVAAVEAAHGRILSDYREQCGDG